ncbi:hypothetical protein TNIN_249891 [Trichonephila inaurata madagascariensis]|uniref:Uncharacterized protein n=1 Tax=Trichonephila inaurata madagascariensis TaxID=2747483 RepID=A0A8X6YKF8_9ARAC|nr:hypothetical protein TNIN_249891 [Trichonephila inaurata madagascariensis]
MSLPVPFQNAILKRTSSRYGQEFSRVTISRKYERHLRTLEHISLGNFEECSELWNSTFYDPFPAYFLLSAPKHRILFPIPFEKNSAQSTLFDIKDSIASMLKLITI